MNEPQWLWAVVIVLLLALVAIDTFVLGRGSRETATREAALVSLAWVAVAVAFGIGVLVIAGGGRAEEYFSAYFLEKGLALDNVFVFALIFSFFAVPPEYQHKVLFDMWGLVGTLVSRVALIIGGILLLENFRWAVYLLGTAILAVAAHMALQRSPVVHPDRNPVLRVVRRFLPMTDHFEGDAFFVRKRGHLRGTPLLAALLALEAAEVAFAFESIPAVLGVTDAAFLVFTSNAFALLGLRAMYLLFAGLVKRYEYLRVGLSIIVVLIGVRLLLSDVVHPPPWSALVAIIAVLGTTVVVTVLGGDRRRTSGPASTISSGAGEHAPGPT